MSLPTFGILLGALPHGAPHLNISAAKLDKKHCRARGLPGVDVANNAPTICRKLHLGNYLIILGKLKPGEKGERSGVRGGSRHL